MANIPPAAAQNPPPVPAKPTKNTSPFCNVRDFGAKGNGTYDDSTIIQGAINAAASNAANFIGQSVVFFPAGTYLLEANGLTVPSGVTLQGCGWNVISPSLGSWLQVKAGATFSPVTFVPTYQDGNNSLDASGGSIRSIAFDVLD